MKFEEFNKMSLEIFEKWEVEKIKSKIEELDWFLNILEKSEKKVKLLNEKEKMEVSAYLGALTDIDLIYKIDQYENMPTCLILAFRELSKRYLKMVRNEK